MTGEGVLQAPAYEDLPTPRRVAGRGGPELEQLEVRLKVVTPVLGGSYRTRAVDEIDVIRVPSLRGQLRFWWRALYSPRWPSPADLHTQESAIWGRAADETGGRSGVKTRVEIESTSSVVESDPMKAPGTYALWPARAPRGEGNHTPRYEPGIVFKLTIEVPAAYANEVRNALRAWILFGGYGSRTRRGLGTLTVVGDSGPWLPLAATREALAECFGQDVFTSTGQDRCDTARLSGAALHVGAAAQQAEAAWTEALGWLSEFRQGVKGPDRERAREPGDGKIPANRPSVSNWPEADKLRRLAERETSHQPRYNDDPAWPRAGFGLPILGRFQTNGRHGERYDEPSPFELTWRTSGGESHARLASPLIVKALPLQNGTFVPCALWLDRAYPRMGEVVEKTLGDRSAAPFDRLLGNGDTALFSALDGKSSLRQAFLDWLHATYKTEIVAA